MAEPLPDIRVVACNITEATGTAVEGALAYDVLRGNRGNDNDRLPLLIRSRGGQWIGKWEGMRRLGNFRLKTIPPEHPLYSRLGEVPGEELLAELRASHARATTGDGRLGG
jgi:hypothetical protein